MMFLLHIAIGVELIALTLGTIFLMHVKMKTDWRNGWTLFVGYLVVILAALSLICTLYSSLKYRTWNHKYMMEMMQKKK
jgi:uncharacterized membrane protein YfcA